jgi:putative transposase
LFKGIAERFGHETVSVEVEVEIAPDHVQLFVEADSKWSPAEIAKQFIGYSGRTILKGHPEIKQRYLCGRMATMSGRRVEFPRTWFVDTLRRRRRRRRRTIRRVYAIHPRVR